MTPERLIFSYPRREFYDIVFPDWVDDECGKCGYRGHTIEIYMYRKRLKRTKPLCAYCAERVLEKLRSMKNTDFMELDMLEEIFK
ncbi:MAG TPA: hypothetical protein PK659_11085 [Methanothrix sp.]|nr:hypothetical protein [Methanothrix sp.]HOL44789.1 hypothetical protein [Methanothrix sp.]